MPIPKEYDLTDKLPAHHHKLSEILNNVEARKKLKKEKGA